VAQSRIHTFIALGLAGIGLLIAVVLGLFAYTSLTAPTLHPDTQNVSLVTGAAPSKRWTAAVGRGRDIVRTGIAEQNLPGLSVAVGIGGAIVWAEGVGWANLENQEPVTPKTRFRIGTASTVLASAAAGLLLDQGKLTLDDEIQRLVPEFPKKDWPVTLRHLMAHTAGLRGDGGDEGPLYSVQCERPVEALQHFAGRSLRFEPGTQFSFSGFNWIVVSAAIEAAAGQRFLTFMRREIFEPLGMTDTIADASNEQAADRATSYFPRFGGDPRYGPDLMRPIDLSCYFGSSVFLSTPSDLVRFAMAINNGKLLQPATVQRLQTSQRLPSGEETGYGLGWDLETATVSGQQTRTIGHEGGILGGPVGSLMTFPDRGGLVVAVVSNTPYADTFTLGVRIAEAFSNGK
jgi:CubicO group peptidase (beta-lactamase class C family)